MKSYVLTITCTSTRGIVAAVTGYLAENGCNIIDSSQFDDLATGLFFMRLTFISETGAGQAEIEKGFEPIAKTFDMAWQVHDSLSRMKKRPVARSSNCELSMMLQPFSAR